MRISKSDLAEQDLERIYRFSFERFGLAQAELYAESLLNVFELLALNPMMAREHFEYAKPVAFIHIKRILLYIKLWMMS
jgi:plasmid stabilization system protein ParE